MTFTGFSDDAFSFYEGLRADNSKDYWAAHRKTYDTAVREPMLSVLEQLAPEFDGTAVLFRPYRDVRFSKDKSPYKTAQGGFVEVVDGVGYYLQLAADGVLVGGGFHARDREQTARFRAAVDNERTGKALANTVAALEKEGFEIGGDQVRTRPRGVSADHPRLDLMRREFLTAVRRVPASVVTADRAFADTVRDDWRRVRPLVEWVRAHASPAA